MLSLAVRLQSAWPSEPNRTQDGETPAPFVEAAAERSYDPSTTGSPNANLFGAGLPPNVSGYFSFSSYTGGGGESWSGEFFDGFGGGGSITDGTWTLFVSPPRGYIADPASATYFVRGSEALNITVDFLPASPCMQSFTEVGLPVGSVWWVFPGAGLVFASNGSVIDVLGCHFYVRDNDRHGR